MSRNSTETILNRNTKILENEDGLLRSLGYIQLKTTALLDKTQFDRILHDSAGPKIVVFAASWCGYCRRFLEIVRREFEGIESEVCVVDVDSDGEVLWDEYKIPLVPTIVVVRKGEIIFRQDGRPMAGLGKSDLERAILAVTSAR